MNNGERSVLGGLNVYEKLVCYVYENSKLNNILYEMSKWL